MTNQTETEKLILLIYAHYRRQKAAAQSTRSQDYTRQFEIAGDLGLNEAYVNQLFSSARHGKPIAEAMTNNLSALRLYVARKGL